MMRRNREINTINLSMLDVISGAMAAFLILIVILLPYYRKEHIDYQAIIAELQRQLAAAEAHTRAAEQAAREAVRAAEAAAEQARRSQAEAQTAAARAQAAEARSRAAEAQAAQAESQAQAAQAAARDQRDRAEALARELAKTFLVLYIRWDTRDDVDLHVIDPTGAEFYYGQKTIAGRPGELSEDNLIGPGNEVWEIRNTPPGDYQIQAVLYAVKDQRKPVAIKGRLFHRDGSSPFPEVQLQSAGQRVRIATIRVDPQGDVTLP
jgi:multidrug efflux pump subunit AcrA (membrane-fusion protein)